MAGGVSLAALAFVARADAAPEAPEASTRDGRVQGFYRNGARIFLGIPYGASTAGPGRFRPPAPPSRWEGVRDATRLGPRAPQKGVIIYKAPLVGAYFTGGRAAELIALEEPMGEDCLVLNVLTPASSAKGRAVLVYFHGGGFESGSGAVHTLGDRFVAEEDVILVTVNHRLNVPGFLYLGGLSPDYAVGNPGMLDLVQALQWVRDNIAEFGGDPAKVTIFGESGGGAKVALLMAMPQAQGLFRAAIIESGAPPKPESADAATVRAVTTLEKAGVGPNALSELQTIPWEALLAHAERCGPTADGYTLTADMWAGGAPKTCADVPLIVGNTAQEATLLVGLFQPKLFAIADFPAALSALATQTGKSAEALAPAMNAYRAVYPKESPDDIFWRMASIAGIGRHGRLIADAKAQQAAPVYYYRTEYDTQLPPGLRAFHTCEMPLAMRLVAQPRAEGLSRQLAGAWASFARTGGDPNHSSLPRWGRYRPGGEGPIMLFDLESRVGRDPEEEAQQRLRAALA
jgi:para-nitrobenzyl esterase